ncbi:MAG: hypothetical protein AB7O98_13840 [Hyphomonadaceae bacterium]
MKLRLPDLTPVAKAQLWGMGVGFALALLATEHAGVSYRIFFLGFLIAWVASEFYLAPRLVGRSDRGALITGVVSGFLFPWAGFAAAYLLNLARP